MNKVGIREQFKAILGRNDITDQLADVFLDQSMSRIQRTLRVPAMEKVAEYTTEADQTSIILPQDFLDLKFLYAEDNELRFKPLALFLREGNYIGTPLYYTRVGGELRLAPRPAEGTSVVMVYHGEIPDLTTENSSNFLTEIAGDLFVYGALTFAADYYVDERKQVFEDTFKRAYDEVVEQALLVEMRQMDMRLASPYETDY